MEEISCITTICSLDCKAFSASNTNCFPEGEGSLQENRRICKTSFLLLNEKKKHDQESLELTQALKNGVIEALLTTT